MVRAGRLRERVTIEQATAGTPDAKGARTDSWAEFATRYARIVPLQGRELYTARQVYAEASHRVEMRRLDAVTPKMRAVFGTRVFDIEDVQQDERKRETYLIVTESV